MMFSRGLRLFGSLVHVDTGFTGSYCIQCMNFRDLLIEEFEKGTRAVVNQLRKWC